MGNGSTRSRPESRKARRLRRTIIFLCVVVLAGTAIGAWIYISTRPDPYRPGEDDEDITRALDRGLPADAPTPRFDNVTDEAGLGGFVHFVGERTSQLPEDMGSGAAWGDYDNDGDDDLFVVASGGSLTIPAAERAPSELFENLGDGSFRKVEDFPETRIVGMGAAWGDADGDGRLDLVVTGYGSLTLYRNTGDGFVVDERFPRHDGFWAGAAWGDYDRDGDLDLYVCGYVQYVEDDAGRARATMQYGRSVPYTLNPASYPAERNLMFRNDGDGSFTEVAAELGVENLQGRSLGALWHDLDDDGWDELYVANDISDNVLYRNLEGRFEEISHAAWVADYRGAMGLAAGDWNRDGDDDLFVTHWIAQENALYDSLLSDGEREGAPQPGNGSPVRFMDIADQRGLGQIALRMVGWGTEFVDIDADGWIDLVVANGSTFETDTTPPGLRPQPSMLLWNRRSDYFHDLAPVAGPLAEPRVSRGLALSDYDGDGDQDLLFVDHGQGPRLLRNEMQIGNWLQARLRHRPSRGAEAVGFGDGARLSLYIGDIELRRTVGSSSYLSQSSRTVHFGLGEAVSADRLEVRWPDGTSSTFTGLAAGATWELTQGEAEPRRLGSAVATSAPDSPEERARLMRFWELQRAAMKKVKVDNDPVAAIELFRQALAINPVHEDSLYYLANCLDATGDTAGAIAHLEELARINTQSHRGYRRLGVLLALNADTDEQLEPAVAALERALAINPEETGALLTLGEIAVLRGDAATAEQQLAWACRSNPRAVGGFFLRGYLAWRSGDSDRAAELLQKAVVARGEDWKPEGTTAEGDVKNQMHREVTPLSRFWEGWDGKIDPAGAFGALDAELRRG